MPSKPPKPQQAPFQQQQQQQQQQTNTYGGFSVADSPEAQEFKNTPLDFGDDTNVDPGVGRRTAGREQDVENRYGSALNFGVPSYVRQANKARELRDVQGQGAYEAQNAQYLNQQGNNQRRGMVTAANLARLERLLPQILQTGGMSSGTGSTSGFNTQFPQSQPGFWQKLALGVAHGAAQGATGGFAGG